ncbi:MAG: J domain-containing protein [Myxococcota bacterium]
MIRIVILMALVYFAVRIFKSMTERKIRNEPPAERVTDGRPPHQVLGVPATATQEQIHAAYQQLVQQYHPDRVEGMGPEVREVAERRTKEINAAYTALKAT